MMKRLLLLLCFLCTLSCTYAELIRLRSGQKLRGEILVCDADVLIIRTADGKRFQFPMQEVETIEQTEQQESDSLTTFVPAKTHTSARKVALRLSVSGGAGCSDKDNSGGAMSAQLAIGSSNLADKRIFLGGSIGYAGVYANGKAHFLPIQMLVSIPLMQGQHAPEICAALGYGVGLKDSRLKHAYGGITGQVDVHYRYQASQHVAVLTGVGVRFQQSKTSQKETIENIEYQQTVGCVYIMPTLNLTLQF